VNNAIRELGGLFGVAVLAVVFARSGAPPYHSDWVPGTAQPGASRELRRRRATCAGATLAQSGQKQHPAEGMGPLMALHPCG
jgi:hypothetical protein